MEIFKSRYYAKKERDKNPHFYSSADIIVKIDGGYTIMSPQQYPLWRKQK